MLLARLAPALNADAAKTHVRQILAKLGIPDRAQAIVIAYEAGMVRPGGGA